MKKIIILIIIIVVAFIGWKLGRPLFVDDTLNEDLPEEFADFTLPTPAEFEALSPEEKEVMEMKMIEMFSDKGKTVIEPMEIRGPQLVASGNFVDADNFHKGSGIAKILKADSQTILRLEDFATTNGPELHVILSENESPRSSDDLGDYIDLGKLKGNVGNQNYTISKDTDLGKYKSVVIYCLPFSVIFSTATLQ